MDLTARIPEPEVMDDPDQALAYSEADFASPHDMFVDLCCDRLDSALAGRVLDLGCGPADVTVRLARARPTLEILGVDASAPMLDLGRERLRATDCEARVRLVQAVLPAPDSTWAEHGPFDCVVSNSLLHHLHDPAVLWRTVRAATRPGAGLFVMDLLRPDTTEELDRLVSVYAAAEPAVLRRDFRNSLRAAFTGAEVREQVRAAGLDVTVEVVSDRHLVVWGHVGA